MPLVTKPIVSNSLRLSLSIDAKITFRSVFNRIARACWCYSIPFSFIGLVGCLYSVNNSDDKTPVYSDVVFDAVSVRVAVACLTERAERPMSSDGRDRSLAARSRSANRLIESRQQRRFFVMKDRATPRDAGQRRPLMVKRDKLDDASSSSPAEENRRKVVRPPDDDAASAAVARRIIRSVRFRREQEDFAVGQADVRGTEGGDVSSSER